MNLLSRIRSTLSPAPVANTATADPNAATPDSDVSDVLAKIAGGMLKGLMIVLSFIIVPVAVVGAGFVINVAFDSVYRLGEVHFAKSVEDTATREMLIGIAPISAGVTVGTPVLLMLYLWLFHKKISNAAQGIATNFLILWLTIVVLLALYENALTYKMTTTPAEVIGIASFVYAALAGLGLLPLIFVPLVSRIAAKDKYTSAAHASGAQLGVILEGMALIAGVAAEGFFGMYIGLNPVYVVPAALLIGFGLIRALTEYSDARHRRDEFDERAWAMVIVAFAAYLALVSALSVQELSGDRIHFLSGWMKDAAKDSYAMVQGLFLLSFIATKFVTRRIDRISNGAKPKIKIISPHETLGYRLGYALSHVTNLFADMSKGVNRALLPAPSGTVQQFARDVQQGEPVRGKDYDVTGQFRLAPNDGANPHRRDDPDFNRWLAQQAGYIGPNGEKDDDMWSDYVAEKSGVKGSVPALTGRGGWLLSKTYEATYQHGDEAFEASFEVKDNGEYLGECGASICDRLDQSHPSPVHALGVWVFDKADPQFKSQMKVLMTPTTLSDSLLRTKVAGIGTPVSVSSGEVIVYECPALQFWVTVTDVVVNPAGYFDKVALRFSVMQRDDTRLKPEIGIPAGEVIGIEFPMREELTEAQWQGIADDLAKKGIRLVATNVVDDPKGTAQ